MKKQFYKHLLANLAVITLLGSFYLIIDSYFSLSIVQYSYNTKECVRVLHEGSCDDLPAKYVKEWVK